MPTDSLLIDWNKEASDLVETVVNDRDRLANDITAEWLKVFAGRVIDAAMRADKGEVDK